MAEPTKANNPEKAPQGITESRAGDATQQDLENLGLDELEKLIQGGAQQETTEEPQTKEKIEETAEPKAEEETTKEEEPFEIPEDLRDKSREELIKQLVNLRKLKGRQDQELGELRKFKKQMEKIQQRADELHLGATAEELVQGEVGRLSDEEKERFYELLMEDPLAALQPILQKTLRPLLIQQAKQQNEMIVRQLKERAKDSIVPYNEEEVNRILQSYNREDGRNELFEKYGSKAFEVAYDIYFKRELPKALEKRLAEEREKAKKEAMEELAKKGSVYTEPPGVSSASKGAPTNYEDMSLEEIEKLINQMTGRR